MSTPTTFTANPQVSGDEEQGRNENVITGRIPPAPLIFIIVLGLLRCAAGISFIRSAFHNEAMVTEFAVPFIILPEVIEAGYYPCFGKQGRGERDLGPRTNSRTNVTIFMSFVVAIFAVVLIGLINFKAYAWPLFIYVFGNALETVLLFRYKVNDQRNTILCTSKAIFTLANTVFIVAADVYYEFDEGGMLAVFICIMGVLYIIHGITLSLGLLKYYSYPIVVEEW